MSPVNLHDVALQTLSGEEDALEAYRGKELLIVNVASRCGMTPQYEGLQKLHDRYSDRGLRVLAFPCNQFGGQEPGTPEQIREFCSTMYGVTFPMFAKIEVNGPRRHPLYQQLTSVPDAAGRAGVVRWNFEKFLVSPAGEVVARFRSDVAPESTELIEAIEANLPD
jgi:glutathione peroxidase